MTLCRGFDGLLRLQPPIHRPITVSWGLDLVDYQIRAENTVGNAPRNPQATATLYHEKKKEKIESKPNKYNKHSETRRDTCKRP